jgi:hypothetical protein
MRRGEYDRQGSRLNIGTTRQGKDRETSPFRQANQASKPHGKHRHKPWLFINVKSHYVLSLRTGLWIAN